MSAPYGPPPGGAPQGPPPGWAPQAPRASFGLDKILALAITALSVLILFLSFLSGTSYGSGNSGYTVSFANGNGWATALYLTAGLLALAAFLPKVTNNGFLVAAMSVSTTLALLFALFTVPDVPGVKISVGTGFIIVLILGFFHTVAAVLGYLIGGGVLKMNPKPPAGYPGYPPGYGAPQYPPAGYGQAPQQPPVGYPQQQPQQQQPQQQPPAGYGPPPGQ